MLNIKNKKQKPETEGMIAGDLSKPSKSSKKKPEAQGLKVDSTTHVASSSMESSMLTKKQRIFVFIGLLLLVVASAAVLIYLDAKKKSQDAAAVAKDVPTETLSTEDLKKLANQKVDASKDPAAAEKKAEANVALDNNQAAIKEYNAIIAANKATYTTYVDRALAMAANGDADAAIKSLEEALQVLQNSGESDAVKASEAKKIKNKINELKFEEQQ